MTNQEKQIVGSWIQATGTVIAAIGSTPSISMEQRENLELWGNVLQATGNALITDGIESATLDKLGNEVQAIGNTTVVGGILLDLKSETKQLLIINGNWLQAIGGALNTADAIEQNPSFLNSLVIIANLLQVIGNSLQAIGGTIELKRNGENESEKDKSSFYSMQNTNDDQVERLNISGSWIQAGGSVIYALVQTKQGRIMKEVEKVWKKIPLEGG